MRKLAAVKPSDLWGSYLNADGSEAIPPFQILLRMVQRSSCPKQRLAKRLRVPLKYAPISKKMAKMLAERRDLSAVNPTESTRRKLARLDRKIQALEELQFFASKVVYSRASGSTLNLLRRRNKNIFHALKGFRKVAATKGLEKRSDVWFYPNYLAMEEKITHYGDPYRVIRKSSQGKLLVDTLHFFFVDIDDVAVQGGESAMIGKLQGFPFPPDAIVRSSKQNKFHCYWSIEPVKLPLDESEDGKQSCQALIDYKKIQTLFAIHFNGDKSKTPATSLLRVPGMLNCKPHKGRRPQLVRYYPGSRELPEARAEPKYKFEAVRAWAFQHANELGIDLDKETKRKADSRTEDQDSEAGEEEWEEKVKHPAEANTTPGFTFDSGWEIAVDKYLRHFELDRNYLDENDRMVFRYIHQNRLHPTIVFSSKFRMSLRGKGDRYLELRQSIRKISLAGRSRRMKDLVPLAERYRFSNNKSVNKKNSYSLSTDFVAACGYDEKNYRSAITREELLKKIVDGHYISGQRNFGLMRDAWWMAKVNVSAEEAEGVLIDKVLASSKLSGGCTDDISNIPDVIRLYFSNL
jgi:hypothetical protein